MTWDTNHINLFVTGTLGSGKSRLIEQIGESGITHVVNQSFYVENREKEPIMFVDFGIRFIPEDTLMYLLGVPLYVRTMDELFLRWNDEPQFNVNGVKHRGVILMLDSRR